MRTLAVDHGARRIGIAISDLTGTVARPLTILDHISRAADAQRVLELAHEQQVGLIVVGESLDEQGQPNLAGRSARRFADALTAAADIRVVMWDESLSSHDAREQRLTSGTSRKRRRERIDSAAAAVILQSFLDAQSPTAPSGSAQ